MNSGRDRKRVLIVTGAYAPTMIADMHRARQLAWQLPHCGWDIEILCPDITFQPPSCNDSDSKGFFAPAIQVHGVSPALPRIFRLLRIGSIGLRALAPLYFAGRKLLAEHHFDLVYFSTAQFPLFLLGPAWQRELGVPYVLDLHDPIHAGTSVAGTDLKRRFSRYFSHYIERRAVVAAAGLVAVSPRYLELMQTCYGSTRPKWLQPARVAAIPFGVLPRDLDEARKGRACKAAASQTKRIVYVGTGGPIMARSVLFLCRVLAELCRRSPRLLQNVRIELHGTVGAHAANAQAFLGRLASKLGVGNLVIEFPNRVTYRHSVELLLQCCGALVLGVDDEGYMPSKLATYLYSGKPVLACIHRDGPAFAVFRAQPALGHVVWFSDREEMPMAEAVAVVEQFLGEATTGVIFDREADLAPYTAVAMADRHAQLFEACLA